VKDMMQSDIELMKRDRYLKDGGHKVFSIMNKDSRIFVAGATGMVGNAILRELLAAGFKDIVGSYHRRRPADFDTDAVHFIQADLIRQQEVEDLFGEHCPEYVFMAAAKVGGIMANSTYKADFIYQNMMISANIIHASYKTEVKKLLNLGSSCVYPRMAPQPMKEDYLLTGSLEPTNEPYAAAKISAIKLCRYYNEQYGTNFISLMPTNTNAINKLTNNYIYVNHKA